MNSKIFEKISAMRLSGFLTVFIMMTLFILSAAAGAEEITYIGDGKNLRDSPSWLTWLPSEIERSLFPDADAATISSGNKVTISYDLTVANMTDPENVFGGISEYENASGNKVTLLKGQVSLSMYGGLSYDGDVPNNTVAVSGGSVADRIYGGRSEVGCVAGNIVTFSGGSVGWDVLGGLSYDGSVTDNTLTISGGSVGGDFYGGYSYKSSVTGNKVTISGGAVKGNVYGGWSRDGDVSGNSIMVSGDSYSGGVYGGWSEEGSATNNVITVGGRPNLARAYICGGYCLSKADIMGWRTGGSQGDAFTGNTLNFKSSGISAQAVGNFEYYNFDLPKNLAAGAVMLSVTETVDLERTTVAISLPGGTKLKKGDKIALIHSAAGIDNAPKNKSCQVKQGGVLYEFSIYTDVNNLWAEVTKISGGAK